MGNFDGVHLGHQQIFQQLQEMAGRLQATPLVVTFIPHSATVVRPEAPVSLLTLPEEKQFLLNRLGLTQVHFQPFDSLFSQLSPAEFWEQAILRRFHPVGIVSGYGHRFGRRQEGSPETLSRLCSERGIEYAVVEARHADGAVISSTRIRQLLRGDGSLEEANRLLGHPYLMQGLVERGEGMGRSLGAPTANLQFSSPDKLLPREGVYACRVEDGGQFLPASLYVGTRPTTGGGTMRAEVHILGRGGDLYGRSIRLEVDAWVRADRRFAGIDPLRNQIQQDLAQIDAYYKNPKK